MMEGALGRPIPMTAPARGDVWLAHLDPTLGREQAGRRPVLVVSANAYNRGTSELIIALPVTSTLRSIPIHVRVRPPEGGLRVESTVLCDQIRALASRRFVHRLGRVTAGTMDAIEERLRELLQF